MYKNDVSAQRTIIKKVTKLNQINTLKLKNPITEMKILPEDLNYRIEQAEQKESANL